MVLTVQENTPPIDYRSGFVALIGRPNVGKSTLLNALVQQKIAITSPKPQTTRNQVLGILTQADARLIFIDTPGIHTPKHKLGAFMVDQAVRAVPDADVILWLVDVSEPPQSEDQRIAQLLAARQTAQPVVLGLNKIDRVDEDALDARRAAFQALQPATAEVAFSATQRLHLDELLAVLCRLLPLGPQYYPADQVTNVQERFVAAELVREQVLHHLREEVPHAVAVVVDEFKERSPDMTYIAATIYVERESQKGIVLGEAGKMLKRIGQGARREIEQMLSTRVYLELWVKVVPHWRRDDAYLRRFGYRIEG
ncbi:MAG: GTPase Era [Anaerolineae bacterium]|nr:MAG: GTPase Era [Anaerolineae bacterium]